MKGSFLDSLGRWWAIRNSDLARELRRHRGSSSKQMLRENANHCYGLLFEPGADAEEIGALWQQRYAKYAE